MSSVLIAGCGYVGTKLGEVLVDQGCKVSALKRNVESLPDSFVKISSDLLTLDNLEDIPPDLEYIVYSLSADSYSENDYKLAYYEAQKKFIELLRKRNIVPKKYFFISSTSVYCQTDGSWVNESSETKGTNFSSSIMLAAEQMALDSFETTTVVRFSGIYGPGRERLIKLVKDGKASIDKSKDVFTNRIHRDDCAGLISHLMKIDSKEKIFIGSDSTPVKRNVLYEYLAKLLNVKLNEGEEKSNFDSNRKLSNKKCSNKLALSTGYKFQYDGYIQGYQEIIQFLRK